MFRVPEVVYRVFLRALGSAVPKFQPPRKGSGTYKQFPQNFLPSLHVLQGVLALGQFLGRILGRFKSRFRTFSVQMGMMLSAEVFTVLQENRS